MDKKKLIIGGSIIGIALWIWAYLLIGSKIANLQNSNEHSYSYNYSFSWFVDNDYESTNFTWDIKGGIYFKDKWLKERLKVDKLNLNVTIKGNFNKKVEKWTISLSGLDIIQDEYKKYVKFGDLTVKNPDWEIEKPFEKKDIKSNIYYYFDDEIFKDIYQQFWNNDLVKTFFRSMLTPNPDYYLEKHNFYERLKKAFLSQKLAEMIIIKKDWEYQISDILCKLNKNKLNQPFPNGNNAYDECKKEIEELNKILDINVINTGSITKFIIKSKLDEKVYNEIVYENRTFKELTVKYGKILSLIIDRKWFKYINLNYQDNKGKAIIKYERWKTDLFADIDIKDWNDILKIQYKDKQGILSAKINNTLISATYKDKTLKYTAKSNNFTANFKINFENNYFTYKYQAKDKSEINISYDGKNLNGYIISNWIEIAKLNLNLKTLEWEAKINGNLINLDISSTEDNGILKIKWNWYVKDRKYNWREWKFEDVKYDINIDLQKDKNHISWVIKIDALTLNIDAKYGKEYDITIKGNIDNKQSWTLKIKWNNLNWKITFDMGYTPLLIIDYKLDENLHNIDIKVKIQYGSSTEFYFTRKYNKGKDNIQWGFKVNWRYKFKYSLKWEIKKGWVKFEIPSNYQKAPKDLQEALSFYSLPNFDTQFTKNQLNSIKNFKISNYINKYSVSGMIVVAGIVASASYYKIKNSQKKARDIARKVALSNINTSLSMYLADEWRYPKELSEEYLGRYIAYIPKDPLTQESYFYHPLTLNGENNTAFILWAKMELPENCNSNIYSKEELNNLLKKYNYNALNLQTAIYNNTNKSYKPWCFYVIIESY